MIESLSALGTPHKLNTQNSQTYTTKLSGFCSGLFILLTIIASINIANNYLDTTSPQVTLSSEWSPKAANFHRVLEQIYPAFAVSRTNSYINGSEIPKWITGATRMVTHQGDLAKNEFNRTTANFNFMHVCSDLAPEEQFFVSKAFSDLISAQLIDYALCPSTKGRDFHFTDEKMRVYGNEFDLPSSFSSDDVYPCSLEDESLCASAEELARTTIINPYMLKGLDYSKKEDPVGFRRESTFSFSINLRKTIIIRLYFKENRIVDDTKDFRDPEVTNVFYNIEDIRQLSKTRDGSTYCTKESIVDETCDPYLILEFRASNMVTTVQRKYKKLFSSLAEVGGFWDVFNIGLGLLLWLRSMRILNKFLRRKFWEELDVLGDEETKRLEESFNGKHELEKAKDELFQRSMDVGYIMDQSAKMSILIEIFFDKDSEILSELLILKNSKKYKTSEQRTKSSKILEKIQKLKRYSKLEKDPYRQLFQKSMIDWIQMDMQNSTLNLDNSEKIE